MDDLQQAKDQLNAMLITLLDKMIAETKLKKIQWKSSANDTKFYYTLDEKFAIEFKFDQKTQAKSYSLKIIQPNISRVSEIKDINSVDGEIYQKAEELYALLKGLGVNNILKKKDLVESFLKELK